MVANVAIEAAPTGSQPSRVISRLFAPTPDAARAARAFVAERVPAACRSVAELLVSEMATNALRHAVTPFRVGVVTSDPVRLEVWDRSTDVPLLRPTTLDADSGRGLHILAVLSTAWGVDVLDGGKVVWCEFPAAGPRLTPDTLR